MKKFFGLSWLPLNPDLGLLALRAVVGWLVIRYHGWGKLAGWADEKLHLPNLFSLAGFEREFHTFPNYIGISSELSYVLVVWCETLGALFLIAGLCTRFHALGLFITMMVAWIFHHHLLLAGPGSGELPFSWAFVFLLLALTGPGKYSLDQKFGIGRTSTPKNS